MAVQSRGATGNLLIDRLPGVEQRRFVARCEIQELVRGEVLCRVMQPLDRIYFPTTGFVSLIATVDVSSRLEVGLIGDEGAIGVPHALGMSLSNTQAVVQGEGSALCMDSESFASEIDRNKPLARLMRRYLFSRLHQLAQLAACTRYHLIEARLARWLLMTQDRAHTDHFFLTHELLGSVLGVRRVGITTAASEFQRQKLIQYSRGRITVLNRRALKSKACSCYRLDRESYDQSMDSR